MYSNHSSDLDHGVDTYPSSHHRHLASPSLHERQRNEVLNTMSDHDHSYGRERPVSYHAQRREGHYEDDIYAHHPDSRRDYYYRAYPPPPHDPRDGSRDYYVEERTQGRPYDPSLRPPMGLSSHLQSHHYAAEAHHHPNPQATTRGRTSISTPSPPSAQALPPAHPTGGACTCKKSKCLKLYCQCFASSTTCGPKCKCTTCRNTPLHGRDIHNARKVILERNPSAFEDKFREDIDEKAGVKVSQPRPHSPPMTVDRLHSHPQEASYRLPPTAPSPSHAPIDATRSPHRHRLGVRQVTPDGKYQIQELSGGRRYVERMSDSHPEHPRPTVDHSGTEHHGPRYDSRTLHRGHDYGDHHDRKDQYQELNSIWYRQQQQHEPQKSPLTNTRGAPPHTPHGQSYRGVGAYGQHEHEDYHSSYRHSPVLGRSISFSNDHYDSRDSHPPADQGSLRRNESHDGGPTSPEVRPIAPIPSGEASLERKKQQPPASHKQQPPASHKQQPPASHKQGCKCRKSLCLKKYCECYSCGAKCGAACKCVNCKNRPDVEGHHETKERGAKATTSPDGISRGKEQAQTSPPSIPKTVSFAASPLRAPLSPVPREIQFYRSCVEYKEKYKHARGSASRSWQKGPLPPARQVIGHLSGERDSTSLDEATEERRRVERVSPSSHEKIASPPTRKKVFPRKDSLSYSGPEKDEAGADEKEAALAMTKLFGGTTKDGSDESGKRNGAEQLRPEKPSKKLKLMQLSRQNRANQDEEKSNGFILPVVSSGSSHGSNSPQLVGEDTAVKRDQHRREPSPLSMATSAVSSKPQMQRSCTVDEDEVYPRSKRETSRMHSYASNATTQSAADYGYSHRPPRQQRDSSSPTRCQNRRPQVVSLGRSFSGAEDYNGGPKLLHSPALNRRFSRGAGDVNTWPRGARRPTLSRSFSNGADDGNRSQGGGHHPALRRTFSDGADDRNSDRARQPQGQDEQRQHNFPTDQSTDRAQPANPRPTAACYVPPPSLPSVLSYRKICSHCGKSRSEHGELGFGNKCVYKHCGRCGAGIETHAEAGVPMGYGCTLTVEEGAQPGAAEAYQRKIEDLVLRAEVSRGEKMQVALRETLVGAS